MNIAQKHIGIIAHAVALEGAERSLLELIFYLRSKNYKLTIIVPSEGDFTLKLRENNIAYHHVPFSWWHTSGNEFDKNWTRKNLIAATSIGSILARNKVNLVYTNTSVVSVGALAAAQLNLPHIWHLRELAHGLVFEKHKMALQKIGGFIGSSSNQVIVNSKATLEAWQPLLGTQQVPKIVYNHIHKPKFSLSSRDQDDFFRIAVIGSILPIKAQIDVLRGMKLLQAKSVSYRLRFIGPVRDLNYKMVMDSFIADAKMKESVSFTGFEEHPFGGSDRIDLVVIPGASEGFGRVAAEALMCGLPVLAAAGGGIADLIKDGETGFTYPEGDIDAMTKSIGEINKNYPAALEIARAGNLEISQKLSVQNTLRKLEKILAKTLSEKNPLNGSTELFATTKDSEASAKEIPISELVKEIISRIRKKFT